MKKIVLLGALCLSMGVFTACSSDDDNKSIQIDQTELPTVSRSFIEDNFSNLEVRKMEKKHTADKVTGKLYEIEYTSGLEVDLDEAGNWVSVEQDNNQPLPTTDFIDANIVKYVADNYPQQKISGIERKRNGKFEVELTNDVELIFNANGEFIAVDKDNNNDNNSNDDTIIDANTLPQESKNFLDTYFKDIKVRKAEKNARVERDGTLYEVELVNGEELDFNEAGKWISVDADDNRALSSTSFIPENIVSYLAEKYPTSKINGIEIEPNGEYSVDLTKTDKEIIFDSKGNFVREIRD